MDDFDVEDFNTGSNFVDKEALKASGPRQVKIAAVEQRDGIKDANGKSTPELVLIFSDATKFGLRAKTNRDELKEQFGRRTSGWIGQVIELYVDPTVRNPQGAKVGGIRVRIPASDGKPLEFTSELESEEDEPAPAESAKAPVGTGDVVAGPRVRGGAKRR